METLWRKKKKKTLFSENPFIYYNTQRMTSEVRWFVHRHDWMRADQKNDARRKKKRKQPTDEQLHLLYHLAAAEPPASPNTHTLPP